MPLIKGEWKGIHLRKYFAGWAFVFFQRASFMVTFKEKTMNASQLTSYGLNCKKHRFDDRLKHFDVHTFHSFGGGGGVCVCVRVSFFKLKVLHKRH